MQHLSHLKESSASSPRHVSIDRIRDTVATVSAAIVLSGCATGPYYGIPTTQQRETVRVDTRTGQTERRQDSRTRQDVYINGQICTNQTQQSVVNGRVVQQNQTTNCRPRYNNSYYWRYRY